jgi:hypothetical protein
MIVVPAMVNVMATLPPTTAISLDRAGTVLAIDLAKHFLRHEVPSFSLGATVQIGILVAGAVYL